MSGNKREKTDPDVVSVETSNLVVGPALTASDIERDIAKYDGLLPGDSALLEALDGLLVHLRRCEAV